MPETSGAPSKLPANRISKRHVPASVRRMPLAGASRASAVTAATGGSAGRASRRPPWAASDDAAALTNPSIPAATQLPTPILMTTLLRVV